MKAFIAGIITLSLLIGAVCANAFSIINNTDKLISSIDALPDNTAIEKIDELQSIWERCKRHISLSVRRDNIDVIDDTMEQLKLYCREKDEPAYLYAKKRLLCTIKRLRKTESFSLSRIF